MLTLLLLLASADAHVWAQRPIRLVLPSAPGGGNDIVSRVIAQYLERELKQHVIVDNRPGASGQIAMSIMANADPDGRTLLNLGEGFSDQELRSRGLEVIVTSARQPFTLTVNRERLPATTVSQMVQLVRQRPDEYLWGSNGEQSTIYDGSTRFLNLYQLSARHVPYKGGSTVITAVLSGETQILFTGLAPMLGHLRSDKIRVLAITGASRHPLAPDLPTFGEQGYAAYDYQVLFRLVAPRSTPLAVKKQLAHVVKNIPPSEWQPRGLTPDGRSVYLSR